MSLLSAAVKGMKPKPLNLLIYGVEGIGKSSFAQEAPDVIYVGAEENDELKKGHKLPPCTTWNEFMAYLDALINDDHKFKTVVVDTLDSLEILAHKDILENDKGTTMARACGGYGAGYQKASEMFVDVRRKLQILRDDKGMNIIMLCHCEKVRVSDPINLIDYDSYQMKLDKRIVPLFKDWVSAILFANYQNHRTETAAGKQVIVSDGSRCLYTEKTPGYDAKNRFNLPEIMPFEQGKAWGLVTGYIKQYYAQKES